VAIISSVGAGALPTGAVAGSVVKGQGTNSQVMVSKVTTANVESREAFVAWGDLPKWRGVWAALSAEQKTSWNEFSQGNADYGFQGAPRLKSGAEHFAAYWNRWEIMEGDEPEPPYDVPEAPVWTCPNPPFREFLINDPGFAMVTATSSATPTQIFAASRQPTMGKGKMARATMQPLITLDFSELIEDEAIAAACDAAAEKYGVLGESPNAQQWYALWERVGGYARVLRDPCFTPGWEIYPDVLRIFARRTDGVSNYRTVYRVPDTWYWTAADGRADILRIGPMTGKPSWQASCDVESIFSNVKLSGERLETRFVQGLYTGTSGQFQAMRVFQGESPPP
jgi:hypothetical protein